MAGAGSGTILGGGNEFARRSIPVHRPRNGRPPLCRRPRYAARGPGRERHQDRADNRRPPSWDARLLRVEQGQAVRNGRPRYRRQPSQVPAVRRGRRYRELLLRREPLRHRLETASPSSTSPCLASAPAIPITTCAAAKSSFHPRPVSTSTAVPTTPKAPASSPCPTPAYSPPWSPRRPSPPLCFIKRGPARSRTSSYPSTTPCSPRWVRPSSADRTSPSGLRHYPPLSAGSTVARMGDGSI